MLTELLESTDCSVCERSICEGELADIDGLETICLDCCFDPPETWSGPYIGIEHEMCDDHEMLEAFAGARGNALVLVLALLLFMSALLAVGAQIVRLFSVLCNF